MDEEERQTVRSPNYPAFGLSAAIERAEKLYQIAGKASVTTLAAVKSWGYNSLNGRSLRALGAMRQYGLLEDTNPKMVRLSQTALVILRGAPESPERRAALREAAIKPSAFAMLFDQYPDGFPADEAMISQLEINSPFTGDAARKLIAAFRDTLNLVGGAESGDTSGLAGDDRDEGGDERQLPGQRPKKKEGQMADAGREAVDIPIPIVSGGQAILRIPRTMTEADYSAFTSVLNGLLSGLKTALVRPVAQIDESAEG